MGLPFPLPANEAERLRVIKELRILDTLREPHYDALVRTAARLFGVPTSLCSIVDADRQWFKAKVGFELQETPREHAFCAHVVAAGEIIVVEDATKDSRFADNPFVGAGNGIRFYAGAPLGLGDGRHLGTLCVIDTQPRSFNDKDQRALLDLAEVANSHLLRHAKTIAAGDLAKKDELQSELLRRKQAELLTQKRILDQAARVAKLGGFEVDLHSGELRWTEGMYAIHGLQPSAPLSYGDQYAMYREPDRSNIKAAVSKARESGGSFDVEARATTPDGKRRWFRIAGGYVHEDGQTTWCGMKQDITAQKRLQRRIEFLAGFDPVTRLANRTKLHDVLDQRFAAGPFPVGLILVDLDNFKRINDTHGHPVGDVCLRAVAGRLRQAARGSALVARIGGDEFAIVPSTSGLRSMGAVAERVLDALHKPIDCDGFTFQISASVGVACGTARSTAEIMRHADLALYASKAAGRQTWRAYTPEMDQAAQTRYRQISDISGAIANDGIDVFFQPKIHLASGKHVGFEALVRWRQKDGTIVSPAHFTAALDDAIVSAKLGEVVLDKVVQQASEWRRKSVPMGHIAVNLSSSQLSDPDIGNRIIKRLNACGLPPDVLEVEITENVLLARDPEELRRILHQFRSHGIKVSLDDFGTGYASLTHLRQFTVDALKIDRSFISRIGRGTEDTVIVQAIVGLAHSLGLSVVAEGIETSIELDFLRALRCEYGQGYLFARPQPAALCEHALMPGRRAAGA